MATEDSVGFETRCAALPCLRDVLKMEDGNTRDARAMGLDNMDIHEPKDSRISMIDGRWLSRLGKVKRYGHVVATPWPIGLSIPRTNEQRGVQTEQSCRIYHPHAESAFPAPVYQSFYPSRYLADGPIYKIPRSESPRREDFNLLLLPCHLNRLLLL